MATAPGDKNAKPAPKSTKPVSGNKDTGSSLLTAPLQSKGQHAAATNVNNTAIGRAGPGSDVSGPGGVGAGGIYAFDASAGRPYPSFLPDYTSGAGPAAAGKGGSSGGSGGAGGVNTAGIIAAATSAANKASADTQNLYNALSATLGKNIGAGDAQYNASEAGVSDLYGKLGGQIGNNYAGSRAALDAELTRLGQTSVLGQEHAQQDSDRTFLQSLAGMQGAGTHSALELLKQGEHGYNTAVTGLAKTQGANDVAAIKMALAKSIAAAKASGGSGRGRGGSSAAKAAGTSKSVLGLAQEVGGSAGQALAQLYSNYLGSETAQNGGQRVDLHQTAINPNTGKSEELYRWIPANAQNTAAGINTNIQNDPYHSNPSKNALSKLNQLASQLLYGKKGYSG